MSGTIRNLARRAQLLGKAPLDYLEPAELRVMKGDDTVTLYGETMDRLAERGRDIRAARAGQPFFTVLKVTDRNDPGSAPGRLIDSVDVPPERRVEMNPRYVLTAHGRLAGLRV